MGPAAPVSNRMTTMMRMPRGLWADLEDTIIQQDRQFLTEVARALGLPVGEVLKRCLGSGTPQAVLVGDADAGACPWWSLHGSLWRPCGRQRLSETSPCPVHTRSTAASYLGSDPFIKALPIAKPYRYEGSIYWVASPTSVFREDGSVEPILRFKRIEFKGAPLLVGFEPV